MGFSAYVNKSAESMGEWLKLGAFEQDPNSGVWYPLDERLIKQLPSRYWNAYEGYIGNGSGRAELLDDLAKVSDTFPTIERLLKCDTVIRPDQLDAFSREVERLLSYRITRHLRLIALRLRKAVVVARHENNPILVH
jgi:hypothetical protein